MTTVQKDDKTKKILLIILGLLASIFVILLVIFVLKNTKTKIVKKYDCEGSSCVEKSDGRYTNPNCDGGCVLLPYDCIENKCSKVDNNKGRFPDLKSCVDSKCEVTTYSCVPNHKSCAKDENGVFKDSEKCNKLCSINNQCNDHWWKSVDQNSYLRIFHP